MLPLLPHLGFLFLPYLKSCNHSRPLVESESKGSKWEGLRVLPAVLCRHYLFFQGATYWLGGWGIRISWAGSPVIGFVGFHFGHLKKVYSRYRQESEGQMTPNGAEKILGLGLLSSQDCLCNWVTSYYFGNLRFNVVNCCHLRSERRIFLSTHFWT